MNYLSRNDLYTLEWALEDRIRSLTDLMAGQPDRALEQLREDATDLLGRVRGEQIDRDERLNRQVQEALEQAL